MLNTQYLQFWWEMTGCLIQREIKTQRINQPADFDVTSQVIFNQLARIVNTSNNQVIIDEYTSQKNEDYLIYLDRVYTEFIKIGDKVSFNINELGMNIAFVDNSTNIYHGYISRIVKPQSGSSNGSLEIYLSTSN
jgi:hypothetical protein